MSRTGALEPSLLRVQGDAQSQIVARARAYLSEKRRCKHEARVGFMKRNSRTRPAKRIDETHARNEDEDEEPHHGDGGAQ
ncbi:hypothetical protein IEO21_02353 [Rhodonia placenta]|uniref:Uncharacterized protein n=1 Tax=Rhodonia placenta TaxID=104341 RepID=A0A8H7P7U6_9APHY|nr:hypothetical protein IEO21_02353 [Postia placenta]